MNLMTARTGAYSLDNAKEIAKEMNASDDWTYRVVDCENGLGRIDVFDEDNELVVRGFII